MQRHASIERDYIPYCLDEIFQTTRNSVVAIVHSWWRIAGSHAHLVVVCNRLAVLEVDPGKLVESHVGSREELFDGAVEGFHIGVGAGL